ncbi:DUF58 domain-containing protein, partial [Nocardia wallacei]|uniref:DUF58 domain-containing protein n=1 Tax=Nocardia wallacei TaxID=480035 RepID=UPI002454D1ED
GGWRGGRGVGGGPGGGGGGGVRVLRFRAGGGGGAGAGGGGGAPTAVLPTWWGVLILTGLLGVLIGTDVLALGRPEALELSRVPVTTVRLGRTAAVDLTVVNRGSRTLRGTLWDDWPDSARATGRTHPLHLPPNTKTRLTTTLRPSVRGDRTAGPVTLRLVGPLGLAGRQIRREVPARVRALPPFRSEGVLASKVAELRLLEGSTVVNARGQGSEFDSFREYAAGDDVRAIDWRATARAADVLVRTWRPERHRRLLILLDTGRLSAARVGAGTRLGAAHPGPRGGGGGVRCWPPKWPPGYSWGVGGLGGGGGGGAGGIEP